MLRSWRAAFTRLRALLRSDAVGVRAGFVALLISSGGDLLAGLTLGAITGTLETLPGAPGARPRRDRHARQRVRRAGQPARHRDPHRHVPALAAYATPWSARTWRHRSRCRCRSRWCWRCWPRSISVGFGLENTISIADFVVISVIGGFLSSIVVLAITVAVAQLEHTPQLGSRQRRRRRSSPRPATWSRCRRCSSRPTSSGVAVGHAGRCGAVRGRRHRGARRERAVAVPDPAAHRPRVPAGARRSPAPST